MSRSSVGSVLRQSPMAGCRQEAREGGVLCLNSNTFVFVRALLVQLRHKA